MNALSPVQFDRRAEQATGVMGMASEQSAGMGEQSMGMGEHSMGMGEASRP